MQEKIQNSSPKFALAFCAVFLCTGLTLRIIGLDITTPLNAYFIAKAKQMETSVPSYSKELIEDIKQLKLDVERLKEVSHPPRLK